MQSVTPLNQPSLAQSHASRPSAKWLGSFEFPESNLDRGLILAGLIMMLLGMLLANFGALQLLQAETIDDVRNNPVLQLLPAAETPVMKWYVFGLTSALMAIGMVLIGSRTFHPSLLPMHLVIPLSIVPLLFGYLYRAGCRLFPLSAQLWAGAGAFLSAMSMAWLVDAVSRHQSQFGIMLIALLFQMSLALLVGSVLVFCQKIRKPVA